MGDILPGLSYEEFLAAACACSSEADFRASPLYSRHGRELERLLLVPHIESAGVRAGRSVCVDQPEQDSIRIAHWNIEKGKGLAGLIDAMKSEPRLRGAHVLCLNEVDKGMARSASNADVAKELAECFAGNYAYLPTYIECTKGVGEELKTAGTNSLGLHGLAILSRMPILRARAASLPSCFDYFGFEEKRYGGRRVLMALVEWKSVPVLVATTHLEVRDTPACRAGQMQAALDAIADAGREWGAKTLVFTGDWNTHTFARGGLLRALGGYVRIACTKAEELERQLLRPFLREPLFGLVSAAGMQIEQFNDPLPTAYETLGRVEEWKSIPACMRVMIRRLGRVSGRTLPLRLDWIAVKGAEMAAPPWTLEVRASSGIPVSDHAAIGVDLNIIQSRV